MNPNKYLQTLMLTNFGILTADVAYNKRFRNNLDPIFLLFIMYVGVFGHKLDRLMLKDSINL
jgi:hypothetical protein